MNNPNSFINTPKSRGNQTAAALVQRSYDKVSDEQRELLIDLLSQNEHINIREASDLVQINYENAKSIWNIFKGQGRKHNKKSKVAKAKSGAAAGKSQEIEGGSSYGYQVLLAFDQKCEQLRRCDIKRPALETDLFLQFSTRLLQMQKRQKMTTEGLFKQ